MMTEEEINREIELISDEVGHYMTIEKSRALSLANQAKSAIQLEAENQKLVEENERLKKQCKDLEESIYPYRTPWNHGE